MSILITGAAGSAAYKIKNRLGIEGIIMGDYMDLPATMLSNKMIQLPNPTSGSYAHEMLKLCLDREVVTVYVMREEELKPLNEVEQLFREYGITVETRYIAAPGDR